ncbi:MAG: hypothetical protein KDC98_18115, partial [Planctomycetes bacterium]|nr:hypothetical protein [Planctomycetota bacterium]
DGLAPKEIARRLGISDEAARQRISRGLARIRLRMEREHGAGRGGWIAAFLPLLDAPHPAAPPVATAGPGILPWLGGVVACAAAVGLLVFLMNGEPTPVEPKVVTTAAAPVPATGELIVREVAEAPAVAEAAAPPEPLDLDLDLHGRVVDDDGNAVPGALVEALVVNDTAYHVEPMITAPVLASCRTDGEGGFRLRLERGAAADLRVTASPFGCEWLPDRRAGELVDVTMRPAATLRGRIVDDDGMPVPDVAVRFVRMWLANGVTREVWRGEVDPTGRFEVPGLAAGRGALEVESGGATCLPLVLTLPAGQSVDQDVTIDVGAIARGVVVDAESGQPIAGAEVRGARAVPESTGDAALPANPRVIGRSWHAADAVATDAWGKFEVRLPSDFMYRQVHVAAAGYAPVARAVPADANANLRIEMQRGWALHGVIVDPDGTPVGAARITAEAWGSGEGIAQGDWRQVVTADDGSFELSALRPGIRYRFLVEPAQPSALAAIVIAHETRVSGEDRDLGRIVVPTATRLGGRVCGRDGAARAGIYILVTDANGHARRVRSDDRGRFSCRGVPPGEVTLAVSGQQVVVIASAGEPLEDVVFEIDADGVCGVVTDVFGVPVHNALVMLVPEDRSCKALRYVTDPEGRFAFPVAPAPVYGLTAAPNSIHLPGGDRMVCPARIADVMPGPGEVHVVLPAAVATRGTVRDAAGEPCADTIVFARDNDGNLVTYEVTDDRGAFLLRLPPGVTVDLAVGKESLHDIVHRGVKAGDQDIQVTRDR